MRIYKEIKSYLESSKKTLLVILGPTASGKTTLSIKLAQKFNGEIISTDSRQIYKEMPISTALITKKEQKGIPHHLIEITKPDIPITLGEYKDLALKKIKKIHENFHLPILTGGTGLYISSIIEGYDIPRIPPNKELREKLEEEVKKYGSEYIYKKLQKLDPEAAKKIHPNNPRYIIRAIEINLQGNQQKIDIKKKEDFDPILIGINWPREELYIRINNRVDSLIKNGLVEEVKSLLNKGYDEKLPSMSSVGIKEIIPYIKGEMGLEEATEILKRNTRRYAKRQMTWFRRYDNVQWLNPNELGKIINQ